MKLVKYPAKILETKTMPFDFERFDPLQISNIMIAIMEEHVGIGLSANQVGFDRRIFVMKTTNVIDKPILTVINPIVLEQSMDLECNTEGCLSFDRRFLVEISRPTWIQVEFLDKYAESCIMHLTGIDARCFLHEYDHLNGIVFTQKQEISNIV